MNKNLIFFSLIVIFFHAKSQNLVSNPSFEQINEVGSIRDWQNFMIGYGIFNNNLNGSGFYNAGFYDKRIKQDYFIDKTLMDGNIAIQLGYVAGVGFNQQTQGSSNYLTQMLKNPLIIGSIYKISYWVYYSSVITKENLKPQVSEASNHVGVLLTNKKIVGNYNFPTIQKNAITPNNDTIIFDRWVKKEVFITPTCELNYIYLGVFKEKTWQITSASQDCNFFCLVDNIVIEKLAYISNQPINSNYYCNETEKEEPYEELNFDTDIQFDYNSDNIKSTLQLDTFAQHALKHKDQIYYLSGHSDKTGINKLEISKKRVENVVKYIQERYKIPKYRLITGYFGDKYAINTPNDAINRRVHITASPIPKSMACYRDALQQIKLKNYDAAMNMLNCWVTNGGDDDKILVYFDPAINEIRKHKGWKFIDDNVRKTYKKYKNPTYAFLLDSLYVEDQKYRGLTSYIQDLDGYNAEIDTTELKYPPISMKELNKRDSLIYIQITALINKYGYPKQGEIGKRAAQGATKILIHSHNISDIKKYLPILEAYCKEGEGDWGHYAMLYDKLCTLEEKVPQRYGTQFVGDTNGAEFMTLYKYESKEAVNEARRKIALPPLNDEYFSMKIPTNQRFQGVK